ncbi:MAG: TasA family protein [Bacilli bacterium]
MENNKGQTIFMSVIGIATLLVAIIGATFAYFTASVTGNDKASSIIVNTATIASIDFQDGPLITLPNALPGDSVEKTFTIALSGTEVTTVAMAYEVLFTTTNNGIDDLNYTLTCTNAAGVPTTAGINSLKTPLTNTKIGSGTFAAGVTALDRTHTWKIVVKFPETGSNQNSQQGKAFTGALQVKFAGGNDIYYNNSNTGGTGTKPTV